MTLLNGPDLLAAANAATILEAHLAYASMGISTLPKLKGDKFSGLKNWQSIYDPDERTIRAWHASGKYDGMAIKPGAHSCNLCYIDADGQAAYDLLIAQFPELANAYTELTGSGDGYHVFIQVGTLPTMDTGKITRNGILGTDDLGLELFFNTGAVVVAPSIHPSGNRYTVHNPAPVLRVDNLDELIAWLYTLETKADRQRRARQTTAGLGKVYDGARAPRNGNIAPALVDDIKRMIGATKFGAGGFSQPIRCIMANHEHDDTHPAAAWNDKYLYFTCRKCEDSIGAHASGEILSLDVDSYYEQRQPAAIQRDPNPPSDKVATLRQYGALACSHEHGRTAGLLALYMQPIDADGWTVADLAERANINKRQAQRWIDQCLTSGFVVTFDKITDNKEQDSIICKSVKRRRGAAVARRYRLNIHYARIALLLRERVQQLAERPTSNIVYKEIASAAGLDELTAEHIELITAETAETIDGSEVNAQNERWSWKKAAELAQLAIIDPTPYNPNMLPASPSDLSASLIETLIATKPTDHVWLQGDLMWVAGVKRSSIPALIHKTKFAPAAKPTFVDVPVKGSAEVREQRRKYRGVPVAWVFPNGDCVPYRHTAPAGAKCVRLNIGKTYSPAPVAKVETKTSSAVHKTAELTPQQKSERDQRRTRFHLLPTLRGSMLARGWKLVTGAYGYWYRHNELNNKDVEHANTWDGMIEALLLDHKWAQEHRRNRLSEGDIPIPTNIYHLAPQTPSEVEGENPEISKSIKDVSPKTMPAIVTKPSDIDLTRGHRPATAESIEAARQMARDMMKARAAA